ncbi:MAG: PAC2 family protein [Nitrososphaerota archaeon]|nr:PAC2 family protein [Nitrososphaerota archaeon]
MSTSDPQFRLLYSQGRELGRLLLRKLGFKQISLLYSSALPPEVKVGEDGVASLVSNSFYLYSGPTRDYVLLTGHSTPVEDQFEYSDAVLSYAEKLGVKELVSFGPRWTETTSPPLEAPKITGFASDDEGAKRLTDAGITVLRNESAFYFGNLIVPVSKFHGIRAFKISSDHGEPSPNPRTMLAYLSVLSRMFGLKVDEAGLEEQTQQLEEAIKRAEIGGEGPEEDSKNTQNEDIYR